MRRTDQRKSSGSFKNRPKARHALVEWTRSAVVGLLIFLVVRTFLFQTFSIISGSMEDSLLVDFLMVSKAAYGATIPGTSARLPGYSEPEYGEVVVFRGTVEPIDIVKRLIGMPGDTLSMANGVVTRNGVVLSEPYVKRMPNSPDVSAQEMRWQLRYQLDSANLRPPTRDNWGPIVVPPGHYFMLGDNRDSSRDSRYWGPVPEASLKGRAVLIYFSWSANSQSRLPVLGNVRLRRIGDLIYLASHRAQSRNDKGIAATPVRLRGFKLAG